MGTIIVNEEGEAVRDDAVRRRAERRSSTELRRGFSALDIAAGDKMARNMVRDLDPQNDLRFLRVRSKDHEMMVHADPEFTLIVIQNPAAAE